MADKKKESQLKSKVAKKSILTAKVLSMDGKPAGTITLPENIFNAKVNKKLMAQAVRIYLANQRMGSASSKTRGEVKGSTRKIYRQKGTGRARHGAITAPIFVGGGIVFGPKPRDFSLNLPKKMKRAALFSSLTLKLKDDNVMILDLDNIKPKTKQFIKILKNLNLLTKKWKADKVLLLIPSDVNKNITQAARNIEGITLRHANQLNTYEVLNNKHLLFMKDSIDTLKNTFKN